jgi:hypothetical protein
MQPLDKINKNTSSLVHDGYNKIVVLTSEPLCLDIFLEFESPLFG